MSRRVAYRWHLRRLMAGAEMFQTTELVPLLAQREVSLSREQVYRLVTGTPERLNLTTLAALCDILDCTPADLIEVTVETARRRKTAGDTTPAPVPKGRRPRRARIVTNDET